MLILTRELGEWVAAYTDAISCAKFTHRVAMTGRVDYKTATDDKEWYRQARRQHLTQARKYRNKIVEILQNKD